ncbi:MAG: formylglycine-generating enzyme family protein [Planctomycetales bacterium]
MEIRQCVATRIMMSLALLLLIGGARGDEAPVTEKPADTMRGEKPGQDRDDNGLKMKFVWCPPGIFEMGEAEEVEIMAADDEQDGDEPDPLVEGEDDPKKATDDERLTGDEIRPVKVCLTRGYWLGKYEVTQGEWKQVMQTEPWKAEERVKERDDFPATFLDWKDAMDFCRRLTSQEREARRISDAWEYSLPTEAEWERACRARTSTTFSFGNDESKLGEYACFEGNLRRVWFVRRVGQKLPNSWGLHDMHGSALEWCRDAYNEKLPGGRDPEVKVGDYRVGRGGCWYCPAERCRSAYRNWNEPSNRAWYWGFRVALSSVGPAKPASGAGSGGPEGARR